jgi:hypothetical protein
MCILHLLFSLVCQELNGCVENRSVLDEEQIRIRGAKLYTSGHARRLEHLLQGLDAWSNVLQESDRQLSRLVLLNRLTLIFYNLDTKTKCNPSSSSIVRHHVNHVSHCSSSYNKP